MKTKLLLFFLAFYISNTYSQQMIYDFSPGAPQYINKFADKLFLEGYDTNNGRALWQSDGTSENTFLLKDTHTRTENISTIKTGSAVLNNTLYFIAADENSTGEIWKTTANGAEKVTSFIDGRVTTLTVVGNNIYFLMKKENDKLDVWKTDGTTSGTILVTEISSIWNTPSFQGQCNNTFMFAIQPAGTSNSRVWRSDGTSQGTFPVTEEMDGNGSGLVNGSGGSSMLTQFIEFNDKIYFSSRHYLYESDGTLENTKNVATVRNPLFGGLVHFDDVIAVDNNLYLMFVSVKAFSNVTNTITLLKFDTVNKTIATVYEKNTDEYFSPSNLTKIDNGIVFTTSNATLGTELVSLNLADNTISNIGQLAAAADLQMPSVALPNTISSIVKINNNEYFVYGARDKSNNRKGWIYKSDIKTLENITDLDNVFIPFEFNNFLYYSKGNKLWKYAKNLGTEFITKELQLTIHPNPSSDYVRINTINNEQVENIQVFDINGKLVISKSNSSEINISNLSKGVYFAKIQIDGKLINKKIIKA